MYFILVHDILFNFVAGFEILAFPCNQFGGQEPGNNEEIQEVACTRFKAEFPIFDKVILIIEENKEMKNFSAIYTQNSN